MKYHVLCRDGQQNIVENFKSNKNSKQKHRKAAYYL